MPHRIFSSKIVTTLLPCPRPAPVTATEYRLRVKTPASPGHTKHCPTQPCQAPPGLALPRNLRRIIKR